MIVGGLLHDAAQMKLGMLYAEPWRLIKPARIKNPFVKYGFSVDVSSNDDSAAKLSEDEDDWHSLQPLGVQSVESRVPARC
jgi:hypothetical protein